MAKQKTTGHNNLAKIVHGASQSSSQLTLDMSADKFDATQEVKVLDDVLRGVAPRREFRVTMAAECLIEGKCLKKLRFLQNEPDMWQMIPLHDHNVSMRCLAFRLHSRIGCLIEVLLVHKHRSMPIAIFLLINHPEKAHEFSVLPICLHTRFTADLLAKYPSLSGPEFLAVLMSKAKLIFIDIGGVEARHASIRRHLHVKSCQTHVQDFIDVSCDWICQQKRKSVHGSRGNFMKEKRFRRPPAKKVRKTRFFKPKADVRRKKRVRRRGGGGAWRAHVRESSKGGEGKADGRQCGITYRALSPMAKAQLVKKGKAGTLAHKKGDLTFGPRKRELKRQSIKRKIVGMTQKACSMQA